MLRTTIVPTILQAGIKDNVIPGLATATVNTRILPGQSIEEVEAFIKKQMNDDRIVVKRTGPVSEDGPPVSVESVAFKKVESATYQVMKDVIPTPFIMIGGTDSKYFQPIADGVIKFTPGIDPKGFHGVDERINKSDLARMMFFYELLMKDAGR
jgi:carboxypeptidase PM20D1